MRTALLTITLVLTGCTQFPELDRATSPDVETTAYPDLEDPDTLLQLAEGGSTAAEVEAGLTSRADALRARGEGLTSGGVDPATRLRMDEGRERIEAERERLTAN